MYANIPYTDYSIQTGMMSCAGLCAGYDDTSAQSAQISSAISRQINGLWIFGATFKTAAFDHSATPPHKGRWPAGTDLAGWGGFRNIHGGVCFGFVFG